MDPRGKELAAAKSLDDRPKVLSGEKDDDGKDEEEEETEEEAVARFSSWASASKAGRAKMVAEPNRAPTTPTMRPTSGNK